MTGVDLLCEEQTMQAMLIVDLRYTMTEWAFEHKAFLGDQWQKNTQFYKIFARLETMNRAKLHKDIVHNVVVKKLRGSRKLWTFPTFWGIFSLGPFPCNPYMLTLFDTEV